MVVVDFHMEEVEEAIGLAGEVVVAEEVMVEVEEGETNAKKENCIPIDAEHRSLVLCYCKIIPHECKLSLSTH